VPVPQITPKNQSTSTITTTLPREMYIRASSGLGCRSVEVNLAERGQRRVEGPPLAGSNSDSIPMSIPTSSHYIERETKTTAIPLYCSAQNKKNRSKSLPSSGSHIRLILPLTHLTAQKSQGRPSSVPFRTRSPYTFRNEPRLRGGISVTRSRSGGRRTAHAARGIQGSAAAHRTR
jgi:hypothetical protein